MAMRMLVIAGLIFAISRPLSSGWIGSIGGGKPETVIVLLDRSASMQHQQLATGETKLSTGIKKMAATLETVLGKKPLVLIESTANQASTVDTPSGLLDLPSTTPTESQADIGAMMQTALDYISDNQAGRTDIWICSDAAQNDWNGRAFSSTELPAAARREHEPRRRRGQSSHAKRQNGIGDRSDRESIGRKPIARYRAADLHHQWTSVGHGFLDRWAD